MRGRHRLDRRAAADLAEHQGADHAWALTLREIRTALQTPAPPATP
ncbi:hypothetical protein [Actinokineospora sp. UTMC 2448]|nr:hypothetical protein [Actinokineospora sp. UTMC 2448]UVS81817.1 hypothetical protein Actkin_05581 [Actinokineospora sp. UTMC 2448]